MKLLLLAHIIGMIYSMIYQDTGKRSLFKGQIIYTEENVASKIACAHKCLRFKGDTFFVERLCRCSSIPDASTSVGNEKLENGVHMKLVNHFLCFFYYGLAEFGRLYIFFIMKVRPKFFLYIFKVL